MRLTGLDVLLRTPAPFIERARRRGEDWTKRATRENINRLPKRARGCLILTLWYGLTRQEVGALIGIKPDGVEQSVQRAKRILDGSYAAFRARATERNRKYVSRKKAARTAAEDVPLQLAA